MVGSRQQATLGGGQGHDVAAWHEVVPQVGIGPHVHGKTVAHHQHRPFTIGHHRVGAGGFAGVADLCLDVAVARRIEEGDGAAPYGVRLGGQLVQCQKGKGEYQCTHGRKVIRERYSMPALNAIRGISSPTWSTGDGVRSILSPPWCLVAKKRSPVKERPGFLRRGRGSPDPSTPLRTGYPDRGDAPRKSPAAAARPWGFFMPVPAQAS